MGLAGLIAWLNRRTLSSVAGTVINISQRGLNKLKTEEGLRLQRYLDPIGLPTIGYGHLIKPGEDIPTEITFEKAEELLREDTQGAQNVIREFVKTPLNQNQYDALTSFVFNIGEGAFLKSTLLQKINRFDYQGAADELLRWKFADGQPILLARRERERELFLT